MDECPTLGQIVDEFCFIGNMVSNRFYLGIIRQPFSYTITFTWPEVPGMTEKLHYCLSIPDDVWKTIHEWKHWKLQEFQDEIRQYM